MKIGISLPQFRPSPEPALAAAVEAEGAGLDGVFVFDHLWAIGNPDRPALASFPMLGALSATTSRLSLGTLVARVGLVPDAVLVHNFETLRRMIGDRLIAGLGTGDHLSAPENEVLDIVFPPAGERRLALERVALALRELGITTWVGGLSPQTQSVGRAAADALNVWGVDADVVGRLATGGDEVTWGGQVPGDVEGILDVLRRLEDAGASWAVCAPPFGPDPVPAVQMVAEAVGRLP